MWFRDLDSNQDTQLQRLMSYRLDDPGTAEKSLAERFRFAQAAARKMWRLLRGAEMTGSQDSVKL
jgi:hypothetical protein